MPSVNLPGVLHSLCLWEAAKSLRLDLWAQGLEFGVLGLGFRVEGLGFGVLGLGFRFRASGLGFRCLGFASGTH